MRPPYLPNIKEPNQPTELEPTAPSKSTQPTAFRIRYWFVTIYFLFMMPTVLFPAALLEEFGPIHREITRAGTFYDRGFIFWSIAIYCLIGAIAGCLSRPRERVILTCLAHLTLVLSQTLPDGNILAGLIAGSFYSLLLAIPFGLAWFILIADAIW